MKSAVYDSLLDRHQPKCLEGTRVDILHQIQDWVKNPSDKYLFWLNGMAGTGKSTISRTIARKFKANGQLGASFFFKRGEYDRGNGAMFFTTIAVQLAYHLGMKSSIQKAIESDPHISKKAFSLVHFAIYLR